MPLQLAAAFLGTAAFALLFYVPARHYLSCGLTGALGWGCYLALQPALSAPEAAFCAAALAALLSRVFAIREKCPVTAFLISGILPLVPGAGIYWTTHFMLTGQSAEALRRGVETGKIAAAMVLAIVLVFELPQGLFRAFGRRARP